MDYYRPHAKKLLAVLLVTASATRITGFTLRGTQNCLASRSAAGATRPGRKGGRSSIGSGRGRLMCALPKVFIDGEAGTTGLQVRARLAGRSDLEIISPPEESRKDPETRRQYLRDADAAILCLPDAASQEAAVWADEDDNGTVLIDASTAFRVDPGWTYGFPELCVGHRDSIARSKRISNPGCYPTGFIALTRPLVEAGLIAEGAPLSVNAISGYSGGGKALMAVYENEKEPCEPWGAYGFGLAHKHLAEMALYSRLGVKPIFQVGNFAQGMVVSVPLHYSWLTVDGQKRGGEALHEALIKHYAATAEGAQFVTVAPLGESAVKDAGLLERGAFLRPDSLADTNAMELFVFDNPEARQCVLCARLDNLGKGASGAAVQNLNLALGIDETAGLTKA